VVSPALDALLAKLSGTGDAARRKFPLPSNSVSGAADAARRSPAVIPALETLLGGGPLPL